MIDKSTSYGKLGRGWLTTCASLLAMGLTLLVGRAQAAEELLHGRVSFDTGGSMVKGPEDDEWSFASVNTMVLPGDTLWVDDEGILEVEMAGGSFLRLADSTKAEIEQVAPSASILGWTGSFYVQRVNRSTGEFAFKTPAASVVVDKDSQVRFDVGQDGATTVSVRWGRATIHSESGAPVNASIGQRVYVDPGLLPSDPIPFDKNVEDDFDKWNRERAREIAVGDETPIPNAPNVTPAAQTPIGYTDLGTYGEWVTVDNTPYWRPTVVADYVPYRDGYWGYIPSSGYSWVDTYPFGYVTSHYGRWTRHNYYGWMWCYDSVWSPAWCATARYGPYFVWSPLDRYNRPCYWGGVGFNVGGFNFSFGGSSFCYADDLIGWGSCASYPVYHGLFNGIHANDVHIWNINIGNGRNHRYNRQNWWGRDHNARDYVPRRVARGLARNVVNAHIRAIDRITDLESRRGRARFADNDRPRRDVRTALNNDGRRNEMRSVRVNRDGGPNRDAVLRRAERNVDALRANHNGPSGTKLPDRVRTARRSDDDDFPGRGGANRPDGARGDRNDNRNGEGRRGGGLGLDRGIDRDGQPGRGDNANRDGNNRGGNNADRNNGGARGNNPADKPGNGRDPQVARNTDRDGRDRTIGEGRNNGGDGTNNRGDRAGTPGNGARDRATNGGERRTTPRTPAQMREEIAGGRGNDRPNVARRSDGTPNLRNNERRDATPGNRDNAVGRDVTRPNRERTTVPRNESQPRNITRDSRPGGNNGPADTRANRGNNADRGQREPIRISDPNRSSRREAVNNDRSVMTIPPRQSARTTAPQIQQSPQREQARNTPSQRVEAPRNNPAPRVAERQQVYQQQVERPQVAPRQIQQQRQQQQAPRVMEAPRQQPQQRIQAPQQRQIQAPRFDPPAPRQQVQQRQEPQRIETPRFENRGGGGGGNNGGGRADNNGPRGGGGRGRN